MAESNNPLTEPVDAATENQLLSDIKNSIVDMQKEMQDTYSMLAGTEIIGESTDHTIKIYMTATYSFKDIDIDPRALQGGIKEFKRRIWQAMKDLTSKIQKTTQNKTLELIQNMQIPDDIRNISGGDANEGGEGGSGQMGG